MAIFYFLSGKSYSDVNQIRATVGMPPALTGSQPTYSTRNQFTTVPGVSGLEIEMTGRYINGSRTAWESYPFVTGA